MRSFPVCGPSACPSLSISLSALFLTFTLSLSSSSPLPLYPLASLGLSYSCNTDSAQLDTFTTASFSHLALALTDDSRQYVFCTSSKFPRKGCTVIYRLTRPCVKDLAWRFELGCVICHHRSVRFLSSGGMSQEYHSTVYLMPFTPHAADHYFRARILRVFWVTSKYSYLQYREKEREEIEVVGK